MQGLEGILSDPVAMRGIERIFIALAALICILLGYRLYSRGIASGPVKIEFKLKNMLTLMLNGVGPGLAFMAVGVATLWIALIHGGASRTVSAKEQSAIEHDKVGGDFPTLPSESTLESLKSLQESSLLKYIPMQQSAPSPSFGRTAEGTLYSAAPAPTPAPSH